MTEQLTIADLRRAIEAATSPATGTPTLSETKGVVLRIGEQVYPLRGVALSFRGGVFVLEMIGADVPPCGYCGQIGGHVEYPCPSWPHSQQVQP